MFCEVLFAIVPIQALYMAVWRRSDKNTTAINNRYLDIVQTRSLILLVNDNRVDNNIKEISVYVYFGSIVNKMGTALCCSSYQYAC